MMHIDTDLRCRRDAPARASSGAPPSEAQRPQTGLSPAEIRQIVLDILG